MPPKRKNDDVAVSPTRQPTARDRKKQKVTAARTIAVQFAPQQPVAGPSTSIRENSMQGLPATIDVERFANARQFEITAMQDAITNAKDGSTQRAWQQLPRHLRRRAASHDVRRVPVRLRDKAIAEMDPVKKKPNSLRGPKRGKAKRVGRTEDLQRRQLNKTWLETHIWHAKRMKMSDIWGYRLAIQTNEKAFRPSHRASMHGSILHDASYYSLIELNGPQHVLKRMLEFCCEPMANPASACYMKGTRVCDTHIYKTEAYPFDIVSPISVMWKPMLEEVQKDQTENETVEGHSDEAAKRHRKRKGKAKEVVVGPTLNVQRVVWVRSHPSVFKEVQEALTLAASFSLEAFKIPLQPAAPENVYHVEIVDRREQVNVFEIMGPKSSQILRGALTPTPEDKRTDFKEFWAALKNLQCSGSLPSGMIIGLKVEDPRLKFPPKNATAVIPDGFSSQSHCLPTPSLAQSEIWDLEALKGPHYKKKDLDERRSKHLVPGTDLPPQRKDDRIPLLLIQRSLKSGSQSIHGWTVIIPKGWSMAFFSSIIHTGTRVGSQVQQRTQSFEAGVPFFPSDYPTTTEYEKYIAEWGQYEKDEWNKKPPAKRVNYEKMGTRSPWRPDWKVVLGIETTEDPDLVPAQRMEVDEVRPWLLRGPVVPQVLASIGDMLNPAAGLLFEMNKLRTSRYDEPLRSSVRAEDLFKGALIMVKLVIQGRGCFESAAMIYQLENGEADRWRKTKAKKTPLSEDDEVELSESSSFPDAIIGYVTTGHYSLSIGKGHAIGAIPLAKFLDIQRQASRVNEKMPLVKVRNRDGVVCRAAYVEVLDT